jgi:arylsulfatase A-like enzyme
MIARMSRAEGARAARERRNVLAACLACALLSSFALACGPGEERTQAEPSPRAQPGTEGEAQPVAEAGPRPSFVLISLDTLRDDHMGAYGYQRDTSPNLDAFARQGVLFEDAVANSPWTLPSHGSLLTGLYPRNHGLKSRHVRLRDDVPTLASVLGKAGYATAGLVNSHNLSERYGLDRGFDLHRYYPERIDERRVRSAREQIADAIAWLGKLPPERPFFLFLHNYDVHSAYDPDPEFLAPFEHPYAGSIVGTTPELQLVRKGKLELDPADVRRLIDLYDGGIRQIDADLEQLFDYLDHTGLTATTHVIITSDHGEEFEEHGGVLHGRTMYQEVLAIPLLVRGPGIPVGRRVSGLVQLHDLFPTMLSLAGVRSEAPVDGIDLVPVLRAEAGIDPERFAFGEADHKNEMHDVKRMVQVGGAKLIFDRIERRIELYDLESDPAELDELSSRDAETAGTLMEVLEGYIHTERAGVSVPPLSKEQEDNLRALGYIE